MDNKFVELYSLDVNKYVEQKQGLSYLSWAFAWAEFMKFYPEATYRIKKDEQGRCYFGDAETGYMTYTEITAGGLTHEMWLPVMDSSNKAMKKAAYKYSTKAGERSVEAMSMFDVNKTVMRCLVKNMAMWGLGLYIYQGSDIPEDTKSYECSDCGKAFEPFTYNGKAYNAGQAYHMSESKNTDGKARCKACYDKSVEVKK